MDGLWVLLVVVALVSLTHRRFGGTHVAATHELLIAEPLWLDKLWSFRSRIEVPLHQVTAAYAADRRAFIGWRFHFPGVSLPGWIAAGTFIGKGERIFCNVHRSPRILVIDLTENWFDRILVEVENPDGLARDIRSAASHLHS
jgi:hypothetical protein